MRTGKLPELLAPAGSMDSLRAALAAGADAVYFGGKAFSNRMRAKNFTNENIADALKLIHSCGAKAYVTVNTRVRQREIPDLDELLDAVLGGEETCDAIICADFGAAARIRQKYPDAVLHASTQTSLSSPADGEVLKSLGFTRLVLPRELSLPEIRRISDESPLETEIFIHGAHCVSLSGQCLMSYFMGGRSGNRGECAQPCRLPYTKDGKSGYPISLSDMCLAGRMTDVISSGAASLKIEGRLKSAPYVYGVTKIYRTLLDEGRNAAKKEIADLASLFTRGFTDGFFTGAYGTMSGTKGEESANNTFADEIRTRLGQRIDAFARRKDTGKPALTARFVMQSGAPVSLTLNLGEISVTAEGAVPEPASGAPATAQSVSKNLVKMGSTAYSLDGGDIEFSVGDNLWIPVSEINQLRRNAVQLLDEKAAASAQTKPAPTVIVKPEPKQAVQRTPEYTAEFALSDPILTGKSDVTDAVNGYFHRIYVPWCDAEKVLTSGGITPGKVCAVLPVITPDDDQVHRILDQLKPHLISRRILCHTPGQAKLAKEHGFTADFSFRTNVWNRDALDVYRSLTDGCVMLSPELPAGAVRDLGGGVIVYGRIPAMTMGRCMICAGRCPKGNAGGRIVFPKEAKPHRCVTSLTDRKNETFPVIGQPDCTNVICNSVPVWMGDRLDTVRNAETMHFLFTIETPEEIMNVIEGYRTGRSGTGRRI